MEFLPTCGYTHEHTNILLVRGSEDAPAGQHRWPHSGDDLLSQTLMFSKQASPLFSERVKRGNQLIQARQGEED